MSPSSFRIRDPLLCSHLGISFIYHNILKCSTSEVMASICKMVFGKEDGPEDYFRYKCKVEACEMKTGVVFFCFVL